MCIRDRRIVVPKIPDKKLIYLQTKAKFRPLIEAGVRIYLYTPGFIHSKCIVADDDTAIVGTCNPVSYTHLNLNIRQEASTDSEVIGILTNHNACELLEDA